jgi:hypothetical protein
MKKFVNHVDNMLTESLSGFAKAHADLVSLQLAPNYLTRKTKATNKVAIISGGGAGHEPLHAGFIGTGMLDAACPGQVFTSPTPDQMMAAAEAVHADKGVLFIVKNYAGDVMNFEMAAEMLPFENATVLTSDDCAVINSTYTEGRRGVAGTVIVEKCVGSLAETGADQVNLTGHSAGGGLSYGYLEDPERAAKVANYVHIGSNAQNGPAGPEQDVPTLNVWSPDDLIVNSDDIPGATNKMIPGKDHFEIATSAETFEAMFKFFHNDIAPQTSEILPETTIYLSGKVLSLGENEARAGSTVNIYEVDPTTGFRLNASPNFTVTAGADGSWGPINVTKGANYEFETITTINDDRVIYYYREGFQRSNPLVYLRTLPSGGFVSLLFNGIPESNDQSALTIFASNQGVSAGRDDLFINGLELSNTTFCDPENNTIALFMYDGNSNQTSDMTAQGLFGQFPFLSSADVFFPTVQQESITCEFNGRTLMVENKKSSDGIIIAVFE